VPITTPVSAAAATTLMRTPRWRSAPTSA
jgi:hypothetical protein